MKENQYTATGNLIFRSGPAKSYQAVFVLQEGYIVKQVSQAMTNSYAYGEVSGWRIKDNPTDSVHCEDNGLSGVKVKTLSKKVFTPIKAGDALEFGTMRGYYAVAFTESVERYAIRD